MDWMVGTRKVEGGGGGLKTQRPKRNRGKVGMYGFVIVTLKDDTKAENQKWTGLGVDVEVCVFGGGGGGGRTVTLKDHKKKKKNG